jgi:hypothetical protein
MNVSNAGLAARQIRSGQRRKAYPALGSGSPARAANRSDHLILPVTCMTTNSVMMAMMVIASPVKPFQKNA